MIPKDDTMWIIMMFLDIDSELVFCFVLFLGFFSFFFFFFERGVQKELKVAWSAMVSCSDLLENDIKCVYWQDNPTCQVSIFSKVPFMSNGILCNPKSPLTYCVLGFWHSAKFYIFAVFLKAWLIYKSSFKDFASFWWTWFLFCLFANR